MLFNKMLNVAKNTAVQKQNSKSPPTFNDTICVVCTRSDKIIVGMSSIRYMDNQPVIVHAEVDACNKLRENSDTSVAEISIFNAFNLQPVLPCKDCVSKIVELNPENNETILVLPDRCVPLSQMEQFLSGQDINSGQFNKPSAQTSTDMSRYNNDNYMYFTKRLNQILVDEDDEDEATDEETKSTDKAEKPAKKGFFNFFKKGKGENQ